MSSETGDYHHKLIVAVRGMNLVAVVLLTNPILVMAGTIMTTMASAIAMTKSQNLAMAINK